MKGLYAITDTANYSSQVMLAKTEEILRGGANILQYRNKQANKNTHITEAKQLHDLSQQYSVPLIINDDIDLAILIGADGVHLGKRDASISTAREQLGKQAIIGCSCYNDLNRADNAVKNGVDYIAFGTFFPSPTKPDATKATPALIRQAKKKYNIPVVAIGGITPENGKSLVGTGIDMLAVISSLYASRDPFHTTQKYIHLFTKNT